MFANKDGGSAANAPVTRIGNGANRITAYARGVEYQDRRVELERTAGKILDLAK